MHERFLQSDQHRYWLPCPACGEAQVLDWVANVGGDPPQLRCGRCAAVLDVWAEGAWRPDAPGNPWRGYHVPRLLSPRKDLRAMVEASAAVTLAEQTAFANLELGDVFRPPGGGLSYAELDACRRADARAGGPVVMGVDVGAKLHVVVRQLCSGRREARFRPRETVLRAARICDEWAELAALLRQYRPQECVLDQLPEFHKAREFAREHREVSLVRYQAELQEYAMGEDAGARTVAIDRTQLLDTALQGFREGFHLLPLDARALGGRVKRGVGEYYRELTAPQREFDEARQRYVYRERGDDHFAHAEGYALLAGHLAAGSLGVWFG